MGCRVRVSRRAFIAIGAAGIAGAIACPNRASAQQTKPATKPSTKPAAVSRLTLGFIGIGGQGSGHLGGLLGNGDVQVVAVCDVDGPTRESAKKRVEDRYAAQLKSGEFKGVSAYNDFRELVSRSDIDAVVIATPDHWHAITAIAALKSGKDVYCEKPMSLTVKEARAMVDATRRYARVFQTGSQQRSESGFRQACELVRNGRIGKIQTVHVNVGGPSEECYLPGEPTPEGMDWDMWLGPAPYRPFNKKLHPFNWRNYRDYSGGQMTDWGAHHFDIAQWGLGMDESGPVEVIPPNGADVKMLTYRYANGVLMYHGGQAPNDHTVNGVLFTGTDGKIEVNRGYIRSWPDSIIKTPLTGSDIPLYRSKGHHQDWLSCIKTRKRPISDVEIGARSVSICHIGNIAYWLKRPLKWDPVKEEFLGDEEANRWLDRPRRGEWRLG